MEKILTSKFNNQLDNYKNISASILLLTDKSVSYDIDFFLNYFIGCSITILDVNASMELNNTNNNVANKCFDIIFDLATVNKHETIFRYWDFLIQGGYYILSADLIKEQKVYELIKCLSTSTYIESLSTEANIRLLYNINKITTEIIDNENKILSLIEKKCYKNINKVENLFIVTSVLQIFTQVTMFSREERFEQTKYTIQTIREKVPNSFICLIDITSFNENEQEYFHNNVDMIIDCSKVNGIKNIVTTKKNSGEIAYTLYALDTLNNIVESDSVNTYEFKAFPKLRNIYKISGRYYLNNTFDYSNYDNEYNVIKIVESNLWFNKATSCFYKISKRYIQDYILSLKESREFLKHNDDASYPCEHFIFLYIINYKSINANISNLGVSGRIAVNGILGHC